MTGRWRVGAILNEPLADTLRFAAWYLTEGAAGLTLLFDDPQDPAIGVLGEHPRIDCVPCTSDFWSSLGQTPGTRFPKRQNAALTWVYRGLDDGWLLNVDADEFLFAKRGSIGDLLADQPDEIQSVRFETAEVVEPLTPKAATVFRLPMERDVARRVYGDDASLFGPRRKGLVGHPQGKAATRAGIDGVSLRQHWAQLPDGQDVAMRMLGRDDGCYLLHFIGQDYGVWHRKLDWRANSRGFTVPLTERIQAAMAAEQSDSRLRDLHQSLHKVDDDRLNRLRAESVCLELPLDLDGRVRRVFGEAAAAK